MCLSLKEQTVKELGHQAGLRASAATLAVGSWTISHLSFGAFSAVACAGGRWGIMRISPLVTQRLLYKYVLNGELLLLSSLSSLCLRQDKFPRDTLDHRVWEEMPCRIPSTLWSSCEYVLPLLHIPRCPPRLLWASSLPSSPQLIAGQWALNQDNTRLV